MSGQRSARCLYSAPEIPQNHGAAPAVPRTPRGIGMVESLAGMYRIVRTMFSACCAVSTLLMRMPIRPRSSACLTTHWALFARIGREPSEHRWMRLRVAPLKNPGLVHHPGQEDLQLIKAHGAVFHVEVDEVDVGVARQ